MMCNRFAVTLITGLLLGTDTNRTFFFQFASVNFQKKKNISKTFLLVIFTSKNTVQFYKVPLSHYVKSQNVVLQLGP